MHSRRYTIEQSNGIIYCDNEDIIEEAIKYIGEARLQVEKFIGDFPEFKHLLEPGDVDDTSKILEIPDVITRMITASKIFQVGPMASIAGAIVDFAHDMLISKGHDNFLLENGGEIRVHGNRIFTIGLYAGKATIGANLGFKIQADDINFSGIATSSATIGHAISFGSADLVTIFCQNAALADAAATLICNETIGDNTEASIKNALHIVEKYKEITGAFIAMNKRVGFVGKIPELVRINGDETNLLQFIP
jgi:hypothetical protein